MRFSVVLFLLGALLGIYASAASAAPSAHPAYGYFATFGGGEFSEGGPQTNRVGVDSHGNILGGDYNAEVVRIYAPDPVLGGTPLTTFNTEGATLPASIAVDPGADAVYVQDTTFYQTIARFLSDGQPTPVFSLDPGFPPLGPGGAGIAVDPASHDLLVADPGAGSIRRIDTNGSLVETIATPSLAPEHIAAASDGGIYVAAKGSPKVLHLSATGTLLGEIPNAGPVQALAVDPDTNELAVGTGARIKIFSPVGDLQSEAVSPTGTGAAIALKGGRLYEFTSDNSISAYALGAVTFPGAETPVVSDITAHSFHVSTEVEPGNPLPAESKGHFEYSADGGQNWKSTLDQELTSPGVSTVGADITGLLANFDYLVRFVASNAQISNTTKAAPVSTPVIAPEVVTAPATDVTESSAVLNGTIAPFGLQATYHFEYGLTSAYGSRIPAGIEAVADGTFDSRTFSRTIPGLVPGATYHFRIVAQNSIGTSFGEDQAFTTTVSGGALHRVYEQVTPIDKRGRPLTVHYSFLAKADGSALAYAYRGGDLGSPISSFSMSSRGASNWRATDLTVPLSVIPQGDTVESTTVGISADFTKQLVATNRKLTPEGIEGGANLYLVDIATNSYTTVGTNGTEGYKGGLGTFINLQEGTDKFVGGAPDFSWFAFKSVPALLPGAGHNALYRWSEDEGLEVVSVLPGGAPTPVGVATAGDNIINWASEDGSRVYFQELGGPGTTAEGPIYFREGDEPAKAITVSQIEGDSTAPRVGQFFGASKDGRYAFFMSCDGALTPDAPEPAVPGGECGVYRYDAVSGDPEYLGAEAWRGHTWEVPVAVAVDGSAVYFRDNKNGISVWRDGAVGQASPTRVSEFESVSAVLASPNGRYFAYEVKGAVYLYDAGADARTCVSCLPGGVSGGAYGAWPARVISNRIPQLVTDSGQLFFTTPGRLVAADANAKQDVYEYHDGRNTLISPGNGPFDAILADVSADGSSVFFSTGQKLVGQDNDDSPDFYVSRVGGGLASQNPPPPKGCLRDDCKATPAPGPEVPFGGSEAIRGSENVTPKARCKKGQHARKVKGKTRCVKSSKAKKKHKKANSNRRQGR